MNRIRYTVLAIAMLISLQVSETRATDGPYLGGGIGSGSTTKKSGTDALCGVGASFYVWKLGSRVEYERFQIKEVDRVELLSVQALFQF